MWLRWPDEIEVSLLAEYNIDIGHWHRLTINPDTGGPYLSSRRLLVLLDKMSDTSLYKKVADRDGRRTRAEEVAENSYNELAWLRASYYAVHGGQDAAYDPDVYRDPVDEKRLAEYEARMAEDKTAAVSDFNADIGWET